MVHSMLAHFILTEHGGASLSEPSFSAQPTPAAHSPGAPGESRLGPAGAACSAAAARIAPVPYLLRSFS
jgi:hypothetical protein